MDQNEQLSSVDSHYRRVKYVSTQRRRAQAISGGPPIPIEDHAGRVEKLYVVFLDRTDLINQLSHTEMTGELHEFDVRSGTDIRMLLFYPPDERAFSNREDMVTVRFAELTPI
jgi:hypothetical protein